MATKTTGTAKNDGFSADERAAMKAHADELKAQRSRGGSTSKTDGEADVLAKIAEMNDVDRALATRFHDIVSETAPELTPRTWYGMPAYAKNGKVVCHFKNAAKFKTRYATIGFSDQAALDDGDIWPTEYAITKITPATEKKIIELVRRAAG
ncbi:iron chaperone [Microlunatus elymi]|nr:DUF1801 domain-containing protein [Microlunatus elymi]